MKNLRDAPIEKIFITDTIPLTADVASPTSRC